MNIHTVNSSSENPVIHVANYGRLTWVTWTKLDLLPHELYSFGFTTDTMDSYPIERLLTRETEASVLTRCGTSISLRLAVLNQRSMSERNIITRTLPSHCPKPWYEKDSYLLFTLIIIFALALLLLYITLAYAKPPIRHSSPPRQTSLLPDILDDSEVPPYEASNDALHRPSYSWDFGPLLAAQYDHPRSHTNCPPHQCSSAPATPKPKSLVRVYENFSSADAISVTSSGYTRMNKPLSNLTETLV